MNDIRAVDMPELRAELVNTIAAQCSEFHLEGSNRTWPVQTLNTAEMYHVAAPMTQLARVARESLDTFTPDIHDVPAPCGMIYFSGGTGDTVTFTCGKDGGVTRGAFWVLDEDALLVFPFGDDHPDPDGTIPATPVVYPETRYYLQFDGHKVVGGENATFTTEGFTAMLLTTWLLMRQPLAETPTVEVDRAARKRLRRAGHEPAPIRVIELRRPAGASATSDGESNYHHQWIVRGHWRQHWYPKRQVHRPVWIAPHIKGPEGAPLIGGEKVYALKR
jgi:hypothetical protein